MSRFITLTLFTIILSFGILVSAVEYNKLVWQDEFNGDQLDKSKWQYEVHCNPQNEEKQCYTNRESNVFVKDGSLHILAKPENYGNKKYTSGRINTKHSAAWKYGRFEVRAKLPRGDYLWPALWMLPRDAVYGGWAASGEIDIMEARGQKPNQVSNALHYGGTWPNNVYTGSGPMDFDKDFTADFHIFSTIWERDQITFLVDGKVTATRSLTRNFWSGKGKSPYTDIRQPFDQPFYFLINTAIGGKFFGDQSNSVTQDIASKWQNPDFLIDYVRVYQEGSAVVNPPVPVPTNAPKATTAAPKATTAAPKATTAAPKATTAAPKATTAAPKATTTSPKVTETDPTTPPKTPATNAPSPSSACQGKCAGQGCCNDQKIGIVCFDAKLYDCADDAANEKFSLCGKELGSCKAVCYDKKNYKCVNGSLQQA